MARDTAAAAGANSTTGQGLTTQYGQAATANQNILTPTLNGMVTAPKGFGAQTINNMDTAAMQTAGGANAGIVGGGNQRAAATNNAGGFAPAAAAAGHDATSQLTDAALGVQNRQAQLQEQQRQEGVQGLQQQYGTNVQAGENALGLSNSALGVQNQADQQTLSSWLSPIQTALSPFQITKAMPCWIAAELYGGWYEPRTVLVRNWLVTDFSRHAFGRAVVRLYSRFGERIAGAMRRITPLRWVFAPIFALALRRAEGVKHG